MLGAPLSASRPGTSSDFFTSLPQVCLPWTATSRKLHLKPYCTIDVAQNTAVAGYTTAACVPNSVSTAEQNSTILCVSKVVVVQPFSCTAPLQRWTDSVASGALLQRTFYSAQKCHGVVESMVSVAVSPPPPRRVTVVDFSSKGQMTVLAQHNNCSTTTAVETMATGVHCSDSKLLYSARPRPGGTSTLATHLLCTRKIRTHGLRVGNTTNVTPASPIYPSFKNTTAGAHSVF